MLGVTAASGVPEVGEPAQKHPWRQVPTWVPVRPPKKTGVMLVPGRAGLVGACSLQHGPKHWCVEGKVSFCLRNEKFLFFFFFFFLA